MGYTKKEFGLELKKRVQIQQKVFVIGRWAFSQYWKYQLEIDENFTNLLKDLHAMAVGPEYRLSYEELNQIADRLIAGEENIQIYAPVEESRSELKSIYTRQQFGKELKEKIKNKEDVADIGDWAFSMYMEYMLEIDDDFQKFLTDLAGMSADPQFERSYEELNDIADRLISGENVKL